MGPTNGSMIGGPIDGVSAIHLKRVVNERGHLLEVQRADDVHFPGFGQAYITCTVPGVVKAWYRHRQQIDQLTLIKGAVQLVLFDDRPGSPTCGMLQEIHLTEDRPLLVQIPIGVWHGFRAMDTDAAYLLHLNTHPFQPDDPDEERISSDDSTVPYRWTV